MTNQAARSVSLEVASASVIAQYEGVTIDSNGRAVEITGSDDVPAGVALEASANGDDAAIAVGLLDGAILEVMAGAAITIGAAVMFDTDGRAITATGTTNYAVGVAMDTGADGSVIRVKTMSPSFAAQS